MKYLEERISEIFALGCYIIAEFTDETGCCRLIETKKGERYLITYSDQRRAKPLSIKEYK